MMASSVAWLGKGLTVPPDWPLERVDGRGRYLVPGLVDPLAHITGGGGEGGFAFRTPELAAGEALKAGVTTLVAALLHERGYANVRHVGSGMSGWAARGWPMVAPASSGPLGSGS